jgi:murein DD-endopeptidase MepM/ murein hydrolase activator NlpD
MDSSTSSKFGKTSAKVLVAVFLASAATGCSSDASRFSGLFSSRDNLTTASVPSRHITGLNGATPVPRGDVAQGGQQTYSQPDYNSRNAAMSQPYPSQPTYNPSPARTASAAPIQRGELSAPSAPSAPRAVAPRQVASAQPFPSAAPKAQTLSAPAARDTLTTGTLKSASGWSTANAPKVTLRPGESITTLSNRYGVPEKEILKANDLKTASAATPGQIITIPTYGNAANPAKVASGDIPLSSNGNGQHPGKPQDQNLAVLPTSTAARDKAMEEQKLGNGKPVPAGGKPDPNATAAGGYVVKPGDTLAKIAKETNTPIAQLKAANGDKADALRIGQTLKVAGGAKPVTDTVKTASIPAKEAAQAAPAAPKPVEAAKATSPAPYKAPVATDSVSDVEKKTQVTEAAPSATGISKYRWPVTGAVIAGYGANVEGTRNDGIDISVPQGTPIKAAENGVVIYAGNGLKQLGNTVLVRHDDGKVTVYGNADTLSVTRGQKVQRGQTVASSGMSGGAKRPQVHFEVRKDATPINPITFLE